MVGDGFAGLLKELKERSGLSYGALGKRLHMSASTLHRYVNGDAVPVDYAPVERFARLCKATPEELVELHRRWVLADAARRKQKGAAAAAAAEEKRKPEQDAEPADRDRAPEPEPEPEQTPKQQPESEPEPAPQPEPRPEPVAAAAPDRPGSTTGTASRPARRIACDRVSTPGPATLKVPAWSSTTDRCRISSASSTCTNCSRGSRPSTVGTTGWAK